MISIIFIDETLDNNELFLDWIEEYKKTFFFKEMMPIILKDSEILKYSQTDINEMIKYHRNGYECYVLYITCYYGNVKCIRELCQFGLEIYHYVPNFDITDVKNIMEKYALESKIWYKYQPNFLF